MFTSPGPVLFQFGPLTLRWYGLLIATAVLIGLNLSSRLAQSRKLENGLISDLLPLLVLFSVIGARLYYVAFEWHNYANQPMKALAIWEGGIAIHGALIAGTLTLFLFCRWRRQPFLDVLDVLVPSVALGQAIGRWGNFFNSEIVGKYTGSNFGVVFQNRGESLPRYPAQMYEAFGYLILFFILKKLYNNSCGDQKGFLLGLFFIGLFTIRFFVEFIKESQGGFESAMPMLSTGQWLSIPFIFLGLGLIVLSIKKQKV